MTLEKIETHIGEQARAEADEIAAKTREECERIVAEAKAASEREFDAAVERLKAELANAFDHAIGKVQADHRRALLEERTRILDEVFEKATARLLEREEYWALVRKHLHEVAGLEGTIRCRAEHRDRIAKMVGEVAQKTGKTLPPVSDDPVGIVGGFVLEGERFDLDFSLDAQMEAFRERTLTELLAEAFTKD
jgi:vacuolar-type H+-ATPase subunit E/Vma4